MPHCEPIPEEAARATIKLLFNQERPTAVFTTNYETTLGAVSAIAESGLVLGRDISLVGFDVGDIAGMFTPRITTIEQPTADLARAAAQHILARLESPSVDIEPVELDAELLMGGSVLRL